MHTFFFSIRTLREDSTPTWTFSPAQNAHQFQNKNPFDIMFIEKEKTNQINTHILVGFFSLVKNIVVIYIFVGVEKKLNPHLSHIRYHDLHTIDSATFFIWQRRFFSPCAITK